MFTKFNPTLKKFWWAVVLPLIPIIVSVINFFAPIIQHLLLKDEAHPLQSNFQINDNNSNHNFQIVNNNGIVNNITAKEQSTDQAEISTRVVSKLGEEKLSDGTIKTSWNIVFKNVGTQNLFLDYLYVDDGKLDFDGILLPANSEDRVAFKINKEANKERINCILHFQNHKKEKFSKKIIFEKENGWLAPKDSRSILESWLKLPFLMFL